MKAIRRLLSILLAAVLLNVFTIMTQAGSESYPEEITQDDFLSAYGSLLKTKDGRVVTLRGTNLGGWLVFEQWMCPFTGADAGMDIIETFEERFGKDGAAELINTYQDNFITEKDFDIIRDFGFNCVRIPFWYKNLETGTVGEYDFTRLDYAVEQCGKRGMYVILDFHGLPGFQSDAAHCGRYKDSHLFDKNETGDYYRAESVRYWKAIAGHFKGNPVVAGYDLMNEPTCDFEKQDLVELIKVYNMLYNAVREADDGHVCIFEGIWNFLRLPDPSVMHWDNVMYELHLYDPDDNAYLKNIVHSKLLCYNVPVYVGEFHPSTQEGHWEYITDMFNRKYVSWTTWTYKGNSQWGDTNWFIYGSDRKYEADVNNDSFETIKAKWGEPVRTGNYHVTNDVKTISESAGKKLENVGVKLFFARFEIFFSKVKNMLFFFV